MTLSTRAHLDRWHDIVLRRDGDALRPILAENVVFRSPDLWEPYCYVGAAEHRMGEQARERESIMSQFHTVDLDKVKLHYAEAPGPGPTLVILHGITGSNTSFAPVLPVLAQQAYVYAIDLRGHNLSGRTPGAYRAADYGRDAAAFLQQVVGRPAVVAGHSLGGVVTVWLAAHAPNWVQGIFLEDPPLYITRAPRLQETPFYGIFTMLRGYLLEHHVKGGSLDDLIPFVGQFPVNEKQTMLDVAGPEGVRLRAIELQRLDPAVLDPAIDGVLLDAYEPDDLVTQIRCPVHLLAAQYELGGVMDNQDVLRFVTHAPHCTHAVLHGAGHGIHEEQPAEYVEAVQQFMQHIAS
jgi:pimeloyl-ACP methyl ester carboxylesterase